MLTICIPRMTALDPSGSFLYLGRNWIPQLLEFFEAKIVL
ncbi:hypothetical protein LHK_01996 [Laribacter hongkongensis HLHK9]|uniref:Uncharacterized protein n=1 Tax=Laribacter hongkongensis (strain HLHK9) TaxID=557598 RepID=C1D940_LARHH|nr:hypothetical protein LHK_01996 [Laribacter hongkongensis HLHK9]